MVNKQKGQLFSPTKLSAHAYLRLKQKATTALSLKSQKTIKDPQIVHFTFVALSGEMLSYCHPCKESIKRSLCVYGGSIKMQKSYSLVFFLLQLLFAVFIVMRWQVAVGLQLLYHLPLAPVSCITAMSATDQYDAGEFELATLILAIKFVFRGKVDNVRRVL